MECEIFKKHLLECDCATDVLPVEIQQHLSECKGCREYYEFALLLNSQKSPLEKAPEDILPNIEKKISDSVRQTENEGSLSIFTFLCKPSFAGALAGSFALLVTGLSYAYLTDRSIGHVENLSQRFRIAQFENIKAGDMLYTGDSITAAINLLGRNKLQIHQNTLVRIKGPRRITLSRGEIALESGDKELEIETPEGLFLARNTHAKIRTVATREKGTLKTETTCIVLDGKLTIKYPLNEITLSQGQKAVITENGGITYQKQLTPAESELERSSAVKQKMFSAVQLLCDCIYAAEYAAGKKTNHLPFFGKEENENKFKVRVFWQEKGLNKPEFGVLNEKNKICYTKIRRFDAS
jgi:hypothetical protein